MSWGRVSDRESAADADRRDVTVLPTSANMNTQIGPWEALADRFGRSPPMSGVHDRPNPHRAGFVSNDFVRDTEDVARDHDGRAEVEPTSNHSSVNSKMTLVSEGSERRLQR
jgi:hypothetical protein